MQARGIESGVRGIVILAKIAKVKPEQRPDWSEETEPGEHPGKGIPAGGPAAQGPEAGPEPGGWGARQAGAARAAVRDELQKSRGDGRSLKVCEGTLALGVINREHVWFDSGFNRVTLAAVLNIEWKRVYESTGAAGTMYHRLNAWNYGNLISHRFGG